MINRRLTESYWAADTSSGVVETTSVQLLRDAAGDSPDQVALIDAPAEESLRRSWTYRELLTSVQDVAHALLEQFEPGDRIAVWAPNSAEWMLLQHGVAMAGMVLVTVNPAYRDDELRHLLRQSRATGIVYADTYRGFDTGAAVERVRDELPSLHMTLSFSDWDRFLAVNRARQGDLPTVRPGDPAQIQFTSGTTGQPKPAVLHHRGLINASRNVGLRAGMQRNGVWVNPMPLFHVGGSALSQLATFDARGTFVLMHSFSAELWLELVETYSATISVLVPTMLISTLAHPNLASTDLSSMRTIMSGGAVVPTEVVRRTKAVFDCDFAIHFGQTELHGVISQTHLSDDERDQSLTIGQPMPNVEIKIIDPSGRTLPVGESGEICARGYQTMTGYFGLPVETAQVIDSRGWLHSGDLGAMDERGYLSITGRLKDMIIRGGENIYPREIEELLLRHEGVLDACVLGLPDEHWGERVAAVIRVAAGDQSRDLETSLRDYCRDRVARFKVPVEWYFVEDYPQTPSGKIRKFELRDQILGGQLHAPPLGPISR